jgi:hypothetical protein
MSDTVPRIQDIIDPWWIPADNTTLVEGRLVWTLIPFPDVISRGLIAEGRTEATQHDEAIYRIEPIDIRNPPRRAQLPVAALPANRNERFLVQRGKVRPAILLSPGQPSIPKAAASGSPGYLRRPCAIVVPCYTADGEGKRAGVPEALLQRIRQVEYPQFMLDELPIGNTRSLFRFDHVFALGSDPKNFKAEPYKLSPDALLVVYEWVGWYLTGVLPNDGMLKLLREELIEMEGIV